MSCPHGNHPDGCDLCDALTDAYKAGYAAGGIAALSTRQAGLTDAERVLLEVLEPHTRPSSFANAKRCDISITASEADTIVAALRRLSPTAKENQS